MKIDKYFIKYYLIVVAFEIILYFFIGFQVVIIVFIFQIIPVFILFGKNTNLFKSTNDNQYLILRDKYFKFGIFSTLIVLIIGVLTAFLKSR